jgi:outer membrane lipoprotein LolB
MTVLLLAGCAGMVPAPHAEIPVSKVPRTYHDAIDIGGHLSLQYRQDERDESMHGSFEWEQTTGKTTVTLRSPLGQTLATIEITPESSTLRQAGKPARTAADVDQLVANALGWPLPVSGLREWLQGFATDSTKQPFAASPQGPDTVLTRDGWRIRYASWQGGDASSPAWPKRIDLTRSTAEAGDVSIRIAIDDWQPH